MIYLCLRKRPENAFNTFCIGFLTEIEDRKCIMYSIHLTAITMIQRTADPKFYFDCNSASMELDWESVFPFIC